MKILVVDDSKVVRDIIKKMLSFENFYVKDAENGKQALDMLKKEKFDLILLDWNMPVMDGYEFLKIVKNDPELKAIKIMIITNENDQKNVVKALKAGADEYLMKPFDQKMLMSKIDMLMEGI